VTTREALIGGGGLRTRQADMKTQEQQQQTQRLNIQRDQATLDNARFDFQKVRIESPIDGIVTRRNIEAGETAIIGTMNNAGTVLLTIADMSVIEAEVDVDETDIPSVELGQKAKITIDAMPGKTFTAVRIGNSRFDGGPAPRGDQLRRDAGRRDPGWPATTAEITTARGGGRRCRSRRRRARNGRGEGTTVRRRGEARQPSVARRQAAELWRASPARSSRVFVVGDAAVFVIRPASPARAYSVLTG
jgi:hypothetical protein